MAISYPCQVGLPEDLDPAIRGIVFLCCDFQIISQEHDGASGIEQLRKIFKDPLTVWAAAVDRANDRFEMCILAHEDWLELRIRLFANGSDVPFLQIIFRQARAKHGKASKRRAVHDCGWSFTSMEDSDECLQRWVGDNWPILYRENVSVLTLREAVPLNERLSAESPFMFRLISDLFGWFSARRAA